MGSTGQDTGGTRPMKLRCEIYDEPALLLETRAGPGAEGEIWRTPALRGISAGWDRPPDPHTIENWLRGAIPGRTGLWRRSSATPAPCMPIVASPSGPERCQTGSGPMPTGSTPVRCDSSGTARPPPPQAFIRHGEAAPPQGVGAGAKSITSSSREDCAKPPLKLSELAEGSRRRSSTPSTATRRCPALAGRLRSLSRRTAACCCPAVGA